MSGSRYVLGISAFYHDSAAALVRDGEIVAAAQEERFSRKKHDPRFPGNAINYCLEEAEIEPERLEAIVFYDNPVLTLDRVLTTLASVGERGLESWVQGAPGWLGVRLFVEELIAKELGTCLPVLFAEHHLSHAASAFYPSPFEEAAVLTIDGVGEWATTTLGAGDREGVRIEKEIRFPHSIGLLYSAFTQFCGFKVNSGEYKLMGLAPYGKPIYSDLIRSELIDVKEDGSFRLNLRYFGYLDSLSMTNEAFHDLFGGTPREPESRITRREMDIAASIQEVTEEVVLRIARHLRESTGLPNLCMAGGVALNCVANGKLLRERIFDGLWIQPAAGDAGGALGAALLASHQALGVARPPVDPERDRQSGSYLGPSFSNEEVRAFLDYYEYPYRVVDDAERAALVADALAEGRVVGYLVGRMEFGPRSLGARSILGDARNSTTQSTMNLKIKHRESFRPFAPSVPRERSAEFFDLEPESPYMLLVAPVRDELRCPVEEAQGEDMIEIVNQIRSTVPAITHVDYSARVQTVSREQKPDYWEVLREFDRRTGTPVIVNTSFNVRGEPIVCSPQDAYRCFMRTEMDVLVLENQVLSKSDQPEFADRDDWPSEYELD
jgi:carbamoyltransferase